MPVRLPRERYAANAATSSPLPRRCGPPIAPSVTSQAPSIQRAPAWTLYTQLRTVVGVGVGVGVGATLASELVARKRPRPAPPPERPVVDVLNTLGGVHPVPIH